MLGGGVRVMRCWPVHVYVSMLLKKTIYIIIKQRDQKKKIQERDYYGPDHAIVSAAQSRNVSRDISYY